MKTEHKNGILENRAFAVAALLVGLAGILMIVHQVVSFENLVMTNIDFYYPDYTGNNIGGSNFFAYFTILSNLFVCVFLIVLGLGGLGIKSAARLASNPYLQLSVTEYIFITGLIYCTVLIWFLKPYPWDSALAFNNIIDYWEHMLMPICMTALWFFPASARRIEKKYVITALAFPLAYMAFSIIRGAVMSNPWYPYPFLNANLLWETVFGDKPFSPVGGYALLVGALVLLFGIFVGVAFALAAIRNKRTEKLFPKA